MRFIILFLVALFLLLDIVYSQPRPIALTNINYVDVIDGTIRIGETTQNDVYTTFGKPWRTGIDNGMKTWTYGNYRYSLFSDHSAEDLVIKFDKQNIVSAFTFNTTKRSK